MVIGVYSCTEKQVVKANFSLPKNVIMSNVAYNTEGVNALYVNYVQY